MAGSLIWCQYEDDTTRVWNVRIDETLANIAAFAWDQGASTTAEAAGRQIKASGKRQPVVMRYVIVTGKDADDRTVKRKLFVGTNGATVWINPTSVDFTNTLPDYSTNPSGFLTDCRVTALIGEKRYLTTPNDTGIIDATPDDPV